MDFAFGMSLPPRSARPTATHRTEEGDTVEGIAQKYYGSSEARHLRLLRKYNRLPEGEEIRPGRTLTVVFE